MEHQQLEALEEHCSHGTGTGGENMFHSHGTTFLPNNLNRHRYVCIVVLMEAHYSVMKDRRMVDEQLSERMDNGERQGVAQYKFEGKCLKTERKSFKESRRVRPSTHGSRRQVKNKHLARIRVILSLRD